MGIVPAIIDHDEINGEVIVYGKFKVELFRKNGTFIKLNNGVSIAICEENGRKIRLYRGDGTMISEVDNIPVNFTHSNLYSLE